MTRHPRRGPSPRPSFELGTTTNSTASSSTSSSSSANTGDSSTIRIPSTAQPWPGRQGSTPRSRTAGASGVPGTGGGGKEDEEANDPLTHESAPTSTTSTTGSNTTYPVGGSSFLNTSKPAGRPACAASRAPSPSPKPYIAGSVPFFSLYSSALPHVPDPELALDIPPSFPADIRVPEELLSTHCMASTSSLEGGASVRSLDPAPSILSFGDSLATDLTAANDPFGLDGGRDGVGFLGPGLGRSDGEGGGGGGRKIGRTAGGGGGVREGGRGGGRGGGGEGMRLPGLGRALSFPWLRGGMSAYRQAGGPSVKTRTKSRGQRLVEVREKGRRRGRSMEGVGCETKTSRHNRGERSRAVGPEAGLRWYRRRLSRQPPVCMNASSRGGRSIVFLVFCAHASFVLTSA
jgi:hypothetical protein